MSVSRKGADARLDNVQPARQLRSHELRAAPTGTRSVLLYTCSANPSGMGVHMLALAEHLVQSGIRVSLAYWPAAASEALMSRAKEVGASTARTPHPRDPAYVREVAALAREVAPDVFHVHVGTGREDFGGARAARAAGVPAIVETLHLPWLLAGRRKRRAFFSSIQDVDRLIVVSQGQRATYERIGVAPDALVTVPNGVVPRTRGAGREAARRVLGLDPGEPVVMTVGRLDLQKGHRHLVEALPILVERWPRLTAVIVGSGRLRPRLEAQAETLGVGRALRLVGHRPDARALLDAADVFVLPSRHEGMPMAVLEAMDAGLPVVATEVIGTEEVVLDGVTGRLVPPGDAGALADALCEVLVDDALRRRFAVEGRELYRSRFTAARMTADTIAVYDAVLSEAASSRGLPRSEAAR